MSKHTRNAERALDRVQEFDSSESSDWPLVNATCAVAEATLALVEQQRIANLIALVQGSEGDEATDYLAAEALSALVGVPFRRRPLENPVSADSIRGEIREALGL